MVSSAVLALLCALPVSLASQQVIDLDSLVAAGDPDAMFVAAFAHLDNVVSVPDTARALLLLERAAELGHGPSLLELALLHQTGTGVPRDPARAFTLLESGSDAGLVEATYRLALAHLYGIGTQEDPRRARTLLAEAASLDHQEAQLGLALMLQSTAGGPVNEFASLRWLRAATAGADAGIADRASQLAASLDDRLLFSGAFRPESVIAAVGVTVGLVVILSQLFPDGGGVSGSPSRYDYDPFDPLAYSGMGTTQRRRVCTPRFWQGSAFPQGRMASMAHPSTFMDCVYR